MNCLNNDHRKEHGRLSAKRHDLRSIDKRLDEARKGLWDKGAFKYESPDNPLFELLVATECMFRYVRTHLDVQLKDHDMTPVREPKYKKCCSCCDYC